MRAVMATAGRAQRLRSLGLASAAAAALALAGGVAYALLTTNGTGAGSASTGTVSIGSPATTTCNLTNLAPGALSGATTCSFGVTYSGALPAFMSLTVQVQSTSGSGGGTLYNGGTSGLTLTISDGHNTYTVPTGPGTTGGACPVHHTCWTAADDLAAWYSGATPNLAFSTGASITWTVTPSFPKSAGNTFQGAGATVTLTAQAVQTGANPLPAACTTSTVGRPCPASGTFTWS